MSRTTTDGVIDCRSMASRAGGARRSTSIVPVPVGQPFAAAAVTTAVCAEVAVALPPAFVAVTATRIVSAASVAVST